MDMPEWGSGISQHLLKLDDNKSVVGVFRGPIVRFYQHWKGNRSSICPGRDVCALCKDADPEVRKASGRFRINFITRDSKDAPLVAKIFEGGRRTFDQMKQINNDAPLENVWVRISKNGTYSVSVLPGDAGLIKPAQNKDVSAVKLHDLSLEKDEEEAAAATTTADEALPF
jgi:hypothetical protein